MASDSLYYDHPDVLAFETDNDSLRYLGRNRRVRFAFLDGKS